MSAATAEPARTRSHLHARVSLLFVVVAAWSWIGLVGAELGIYRPRAVALLSTMVAVVCGWRMWRPLREDTWLVPAQGRFHLAACLGPAAVLFFQPGRLRGGGAVDARRAAVVARHRHRGGGTPHTLVRPDLVRPVSVFRDADPVPDRRRSLLHGCARSETGAALASAVRSFGASGRRAFLLVGSQGSTRDGWLRPDDFNGFALRPAGSAALSHRAIETTTDRLPSRVRVVTPIVELYEIVPAGAAALPLQIEIGESDFPWRLEGFHDAEQMGTALARWSSAVARTELPRVSAPAARPLVLRLRLAASRPTGIAPPHVEVEIDGRPVGSTEALYPGFQTYELPLDRAATHALLSGATTLTLRVPRLDMGAPSTCEPSGVNLTGPEVEVLMAPVISVALASVLFALTHSTAGAQTSAPDWMLKVKPGTPIFVTTVTGDVVEGISGRVRSDSMVVSTPAGVRIVLLPDIQKVQRRDPGWTGFAMGAAVGAVIGVVASQNSKYCKYQYLTCCRANRKTGPVVGAVGYGLIGWGIDTLVKGRTTVFDRSRCRRCR